MAVPDFQTLMLPLLRLAGTAEEVHIRDAIEKLASEFRLKPEELADVLPSGRQTKFANRVHWAKSYLGKAGLVIFTGRGRFKIEPRGREVLAQPPKRIDIPYLKKFPEFELFRSGEEAKEFEPEITIPAKALTPDEAIRQAHARLEVALADELLQRMLQSPSEFFERLVVQLLIAMGYGGSLEAAGRALGRSGDDGVDGVIDQDALGLDRVYVQAKRYAPKSSVGPSAIRDFFGSLDIFKASKGLFVTTSSFTAEAIRTTGALGKRIALVDGRELTRLMIRYDIGCRVEDTLKIRKVDEDFFE